MAVLLIAEHNNKELRPFTLNAVTAASQIDEDVHALIIGHNSDEATKALAALPAIKKVINVDAPHYENFTAENFAPVVVKIAENYSHVVCSANTFGKNLMPRIAALLDTSQISDIIKVISADTFVRPIYAGNAFATVKSKDSKKCVTIRPTSFDPCENSGGSAPIEKADGLDQFDQTKFIKREEIKSDRPELGTFIFFPCLNASFNSIINMSKSSCLSSRPYNGQWFIFIKLVFKNSNHDRAMSG